MMDLNEHDIQWAAGFCNGAGQFTPWEVVVSHENADPIWKLCNMFGGQPELKGKFIWKASLYTIDELVPLLSGLNQIIGGLPRENKMKKETGWLAGFFEASGGTYVNRSGGKKYLRMVIAQASPEGVISSQQIFGGGKTYGPDKQYMYRFVTNHKDSQELFNQIAPWLSRNKTEQYQNAMKEVQNG